MKKDKKNNWDIFGYIFIIILFLLLIFVLISFYMGWWSCDFFQQSYINDPSVPIKWQTKCSN